MKLIGKCTAMAAATMLFAQSAAAQSQQPILENEGSGVPIWQHFLALFGF